MLVTSVLEVRADKIRLNRTSPMTSRAVVKGSDTGQAMTMGRLDSVLVNPVSLDCNLILVPGSFALHIDPGMVE